MNNYIRGIAPGMASEVLKTAAEFEQRKIELKVLGASDADIARHVAALTACARIELEPNSWTVLEGMQAGHRIVATGLPLIPADAREWVYQVRAELYGQHAQGADAAEIRALLECTLGFQQWLAAVRLAWAQADVPAAPPAGEV